MENQNQKTLSGYVTGLMLCLVLTFAAFGLVQGQYFNAVQTDSLIAGLAIVQLIVQCVFFLRLNMGEEGRWNLLPFIFAILIIAILVGGSLWIMVNLNYNMMH